MDAELDNSYLLKRRKELHMTQQQVADKAGIQLRQYQRLEKGERDIFNASGKIMLAVCEVLRIHPYTILGEAEYEPEKKFIVVPPVVECGDTRYIPAIAYYTLVSAIPTGMVCTADEVIQHLRIYYGMGKLEIEPDPYYPAMCFKTRFPYWRVVEEDGYLVDNLYCCKERQKEKLESEGIKVTLKDEGRAFCVDQFAFLEYDLRNVRVSILRRTQTEVEL